MIVRVPTVEVVHEGRTSTHAGCVDLRVIQMKSFQSVEVVENRSCEDVVLRICRRFGVVVAAGPTWVPCSVKCLRVNCNVLVVENRV